MLLEVIIAILGGGSLVAAVLTYVIAKRKAPAEVDSIVVSGAESAVLSLQRAVDVERGLRERAERENAHLRDELAERDRRLRERDRRITALEAQLDKCQQTLQDARDQIHALRHM